MHILVVDDDEDIREILGLVLESEGHEVETAIDGVDALERLRLGSKPSLVLLDLMMPRLDGEAVMRALKGEPRLAEIPVVIMSGHQNARQKATELGVAAWLAKPIEIEQLQAAVQSAAANSRERVSPR